MALKLKQPPGDDLADEAVLQQINTARSISGRYLDSRVNAELQPGVPFEVQRRVLTRDQDDIIAAERLLKESQ